jgi:hypothetical protein
MADEAKQEMGEATTSLFVAPRKKLIDWVRQQLVGPPQRTGDPPPDLHNVLPTERFPCGALYPISRWGEGIDPAGDAVDELEETADDKVESAAEPAIGRRYIPPSSLGFSFFIKGDTILLQVLTHAARYENTKRDIGHGCAVDWVVQDFKVIELRAETMPTVEVPQMTADTGSGRDPVLSIARLADIDNTHANQCPRSWMTMPSGFLASLKALRTCCLTTMRPEGGSLSV